MASAHCQPTVGALTMLVSLLAQPATMLVRVLAEPASQVARVINQVGQKQAA